ncbi:uncharacterized protein LOC132047651 [Lycium ferocissimum]|uniref:uncharacterized protein LOC132047651 n=1 Tax=Lycium ferocissimum TaxID=112874 RepID=UPI002815537C|nr:uncharacterized protein LOC132047651 [Lycium ferocissimum]
MEKKRPSRSLSTSETFDHNSVHRGENEQAEGSRYGSRDIENQPPNSSELQHFSDGWKLDLSVYQILYQAALKDNWRIAEPILKKDPSFATRRMSERGETVLHIAAAAGSTKFLGELMKLMEPGDLELRNIDGSTAFCFAAASNIVEIAKAMIERNPNLPNIRGEDDALPITVAASVGNKDMVSCLFEFTSLDELEQLKLLETTIQNEMYDVASNIFEKDRELVSKVLEGHKSVLVSLAKKSLVISNQSQGGNWERYLIVRACSPVWRMFKSAISMTRRQFIPWFKVQALQEFSMKKQAGILLEELWAECQRSAEDQLLKLVEKETLLHTAAKAGNVEFLVVAIRNNPDLIWKVDKHNRTIFQVAVLHREENVFSLIHQIGGTKDLIIRKVDDNQNNILHLAGKLGHPVYKQKTGQIRVPRTKPLQEATPGVTESPQQSASSYPDRVVESLDQLLQILMGEEKIMPPSFLKVSGAALQMQKEMLWFKEVEKIVPPSLLRKKNKEGKTPRQLFTEEHKQLLKEGERWMKDTANSCMIVAALIATIVFAAAFTIPGGNNSDIGTPILLKLNAFAAFVTSDALALFSSIVSIIMFLSILTSRYAEDDFLVSLPAKLLFGLTALFVSIVSMLVAFVATFFLVYNNHVAWEPKLITAFAGVPVALFGCLQYKLWFDVAKSTYWSKYLFRQGKHSLY